MKPTGGWKANAYVIFDYVSADRLQVRRHQRLDQQARDRPPRRRAAGSSTSRRRSRRRRTRYYNLLLSVNGLAVDAGRQQPAVVQPRPTRRGWSTATPTGLNYGFVGFGSDNSRGSFDNVTVQVLPPQVTSRAQRGLRRDAPAASTAAGRDLERRERPLRRHAARRARRRCRSSTSASATGSATSSYVELETVVRTTATAGIAFDAYAANDFKFAALDVAGQRVVIGHVEPRRGFVIDAAVARSLAGEHRHDADGSACAAHRQRLDRRRAGARVRLRRRRHRRRHRPVHSRREPARSTATASARTTRRWPP